MIHVPHTQIITFVIAEVGMMQAFHVPTAIGKRNARGKVRGKVKFHSEEIWPVALAINQVTLV